MAHRPEVRLDAEPISVSVYRTDRRRHCGTSMDVPYVERRCVTRDKRRSTAFHAVDSSHRILKIRGNPRRPDLLCLSDSSGVPALYHLRCGSCSPRRIEYTDRAVTDSPIHGDFALSASAPWMFVSQDHGGDQRCDLLLVNLQTYATRTLARDIGRVDFLVPYGEQDALAITSTREALRLVRFSADGSQRLLLETPEQIPSFAVDERRAVGFLALGRRTTSLVALDLDHGEVVSTLIPPGRSRQDALAVDPESGNLAYAESAEGEPTRLVVRSSHGVHCEHEIPGDIGCFVLDTGDMIWAAPDRLLASVCRDGACSLRALDLSQGAWSEPLIDGIPEYMTRTSHGVWCVASGLTFPETLFCDRPHTPGASGDPVRSIPRQTERIAYDSFDGERIQGWLDRSPDGEDRLVVLCHGGPTYAVVNRWAEDPDLAGFLVQAGYHVFQPNYRGSTTFGARFTHLNVGDPGGGDLKDVLAGGRAAAKHLGIRSLPLIVGASYGGYLTLQALTTQPSDWRAGVALVPLADFVHSYQLADAHYRRFTEHLLGGTPQERPELYQERSPVSHVARLEAPLLIIAGEKDPATALAPIQRFVNQAQELGKPVTLITHPGGHGIGEQETALRLMSEVARFLNHLDPVEGSAL